MSVFCPFCNHENLEGTDNCARCFVSLTDRISLQEQSEIEIDLLRRPLGDVMSDDYVAVPPHMSVGDVVRRLNDNGHHCAIVVEKDQSIAGIFTERDVLYKLADHFDKRASAPVCEYMTPRPETLQAGDPVAFGLNRMMAGGYRHIPLENQGKLVGLVSVRNVLSYLVNRFPDAIPSLVIA